MEREQYLELLNKIDDPLYGEWPGGWNKTFYDAAEAKFLKLAEEIQQALGERCAIEYGNLIQDASFHGQLDVPESCLTQQYVVSLRVSNFGSLATLYDADDVLKAECLNKIKSAVKRNGYTYLPSWVLREAYPVRNEGITGMHNWGHRYFDYL